MTVSGSGMADALMAVLVAQSASVFDRDSASGNLTKNDFGLMDTTRSGCVYMVLPPGFRNELNAFGSPVQQEAIYSITVRCFVADDGNSPSTLNRAWLAEKELRAALAGNDNLSGSALIATLVSGTGWDGITFVGDASGKPWIPQDFVIDVRTMQDG